jgi:hypothetical protein
MALKLPKAIPTSQIFDSILRRRFVSHLVVSFAGIVKSARSPAPFSCEPVVLFQPRAEVYIKRRAIYSALQL